MTNAGFNVSHWIFSFKYYKIQHAMQYLMKGKRPPPEVMAFDARLNKFFIALNILVPLAAAAFFAIACVTLSWELLKIYSYLRMAVGFLDVVSAGFLIYGIVQIGKITAEHGTIDGRLRIPQLVLHVAAFLLYLLSTLVLYFYYMRYIFSKDINKKGAAGLDYMRVVIITNWTSMIGQILIAWILYPITKKEDQIVDRTALANLAAPQEQVDIMRQRDRLGTIVEDEDEYIDSDEETDTRIQMQLVNYSIVSRRPSMSASLVNSVRRNSSVVDKANIN